MCIGPGEWEPSLGRTLTALGTISLVLRLLGDLDLMGIHPPTNLTHPPIYPPTSHQSTHPPIYLLSPSRIWLPTTHVPIHSSTTHHLPTHLNPYIYPLLMPLPTYPSTYPQTRLTVHPSVHSPIHTHPPLTLPPIHPPTNPYTPHLFTPSPLHPLKLPPIQALIVHFIRHILAPSQPSPVLHARIATD